MNGDRVRQIREELGMTQDEFAQALRTTTTTVSRWENGRHKLTRFRAQDVRDLYEQRKRKTGR